MTSPLCDVLSAVRDGTPTLDAIGHRTGLPPDAVRAEVDHLVRIRRIDASTLTVGCPGGGCGSCPSGVDGSPGCGDHQGHAGGLGPGASRGPVLVTLRLRR